MKKYIPKFPQPINQLSGGKKNNPLLTSYYPFLLVFTWLDFYQADVCFKMFFPSISWPSVDDEADVQSSSSLPFSGAVLLSDWPHAVCWLPFHSPLYFSGCGSWLPAPINRQVTVCWGSILYNLTPFVVSGGERPWRSLRKYQIV